MRHEATKLLIVCILALILLPLSGCAMTTQHVKTADGDQFTQMGGALFSKQDYVHGLDADFYPNNSGSHVAVKGQGDQDSTAMVQVISALVSAFAASQAHIPQAGTATGGAPVSDLVSKISGLTATVEELRTLYDSLRSPRDPSLIIK